MCWRAEDGLTPCPEQWPHSPDDWCPDCRPRPRDDRDRSALADLEAWALAFPGAPPLPAADRPCWSLQQVTRPSPN